MIVSSTYTEGHRQADGRLYVLEKHIDGEGVAHSAEYLAGVGADREAVMTARAGVLSESMADTEADAVLARDAAITLKRQTLAQFAARMRARYREAGREEAARLATWILNRIDAGHVTDAQVRNAFGLTVAQWNALKTKMTDMRLHYNAVQSAQGE